jgi:hypothetical protein
VTDWAGIADSDLDLVRILVVNQAFKLGCEVEARLSATVTLLIKYAPALFEKDAFSNEESRKMGVDHLKCIFR